MTKLINRLIAYCYYGIFFMVPLVFTSSNSELFELSKMWITWGFTLVIVALWSTKMLINKKIYFARTPFDIFIFIFLLSQIISSVFSLDHRISLWGYYSRFNGGLLSTITYIVLFYAFASNLTIKHIKKLAYVSIISAFIVSIWGFPSHFGLDPTCYIVRGTLDISCWTEQFVPTSRVFSTLGQPAWLAAYMGIIIFMTMGMVVKNLIYGKNTTDKFQTLITNFKSNPILNSSLIFSLILFYILLVFSNTRAGFLGFVLGFVIFWAVLLIINFKLHIKLFIGISVIFFLSSVIFGMPLEQLRFMSFGIQTQEKIMSVLNNKPKPSQTQNQSTTTAQESSAPSSEVIITDSGNIRKNVWRGAMNAFKSNPIFGTGVETYAFAYYKYKPIEQNITSEWDYLYNKAHNEYLNYLATTGIVGLGTYLAFIGFFYFFTTKWLLKNRSELKNHALKEEIIPLDNLYLKLGLIAGFSTILVTNFFGFSVVIVNLYTFLIPLFVYMLIKNNRLIPTSSKNNLTSGYTTTAWIVASVIWIICLYLIFFLLKFWIADRNYALGYNLTRVGQYDQAYPNLLKATDSVKSEPVFKDELAYNSAVLAVSFFQQGDTENSTKLAQQAYTLSNELYQKYPNNIVILKNRVRTLNELAKIDPNYLMPAQQTIIIAYQKSPNDAKIAYNAGVLLGQTGQVQQGIEVLERVITLRPNFRDAYFALGLFYRDLATQSSNTVKHPDLQKKAEDRMRYVLDNLNPEDEMIKETLASWGVL